jgi:hypothetical protein
MYTVSFVGLNYFNACRVGERDALIPNGTPGSGTNEEGLPQHFASFFIEEELYDSDNWWQKERIERLIPLEIKLGEFRTVKVIEFRVPPKSRPETPPVELRFSGDEGTLRNLNLDEGLPKLQPMGFVLDDQPDAIAKVALQGGDLEVFRFGGSTLVRWLIEHHDDPIAITAYDGKDRKWVKLKKSGPLPPEIVFSNTIDLLQHTNNGGNGQPAVQSGMSSGMAGMPNGPAMSAMAGAPVDGGMAGMHHHGPAGHFVLFAKLDESRDERKLDKTVFPDPMMLKPAVFSHPYLAYLSSIEETPDPQCSGSCCAPKGGAHG